MMTTSLERGPPSIAGLLWTVLSLVLFIAAAFGVFPVSMIARFFAATTHTMDMALWSVVWAALAGAGVLVAARVAFGAWPRVGSGALTVLVIGTLLSTGTQLTLQAWTETRYGYYDPEFVGWTAGLFAILVGLAAAAFGALVAPRGAAAWPLAFVLLGSACVAVILAANVPGLGDGLAPDSWPLAAWLAASGLYAAVVTLASVRRARHTAASLER